MGKHYLFEAVWMLLLITTLSSGVCGICWDCLPKNLSEEDIDKILLDDFRDRLLKKLGLTREPVVPENVIRPPQELLNQISLEDEAMYANDDTEVLKTAILQPLNNGKLSFVEIVYGQYMWQVFVLTYCMWRVLLPFKVRVEYIRHLPESRFSTKADILNKNPSSVPIARTSTNWDFIAYKLIKQDSHNVISMW